MLLLGPPGNGKTHCLRGVLRMLELLRWMKLKPADGLHPFLRAQLEVLQAQMRSEEDGTVLPKAKPNGQGAVQELLGILQHALSTHGKSEEDDG